MELLKLAGPAIMLPRQQVDAPWDGPMMVTFSAVLPGDSPCCRPFGSQASTRRGSSGSACCKRSHSKASSVLLTRPSGCMLNGPCRHCGINFSPQWRKGTHDKPVLCNACGIRLRRHKCLDESTAYKGPPLPPVVYASVPEEPAKEDTSASQQDDSASAQQDAPSTSRPALVLMLPGSDGTTSLLPATAVSKADASGKAAAAATAAAGAAAAGAASLQVGPKGKRGRSTVQLCVPGARSAVSEGEDSAGSDPEAVAMPPAAAGAGAAITAAAGAAEAEATAGLCQAAVDAMDIDASSGSAGNSSSGRDTPCQAPWPAECGHALLLLHSGWPLVDGVAMEPAAVAAAINAALAAAAAEAAQAAAANASIAAVVTKPAAGKHGKSVVAVADAEVCAILSVASAAATAAEEEEAVALGVPTPMAVEADAPARSASPTESMPEEAAPGDTEADKAAAAVGPPAKRQRTEQQWQVQQEQEQQEVERAAQHSPSSDSGSSEDGSSGDGSSEDERVAVAGAVAAKAAASALLLRSMEATTCMTDGAARLVLPQSVMA